MKLVSAHAWVVSSTGLLVMRCISIALIVVGVLSMPEITGAAYEATTTVSLTVCGDGLVATNEVCDDASNTGAYSTTIGGRHCAPGCESWAPYCGDGISQTYYGEECDDGNNFAGDLCDAVCQNETPPVTEGGGGGSGGSGGGGGKGSGSGGIPGAGTTGQIPFAGKTDVNIRGAACPGATVTVLRDGAIERVIEADNSSEFSFTLTEQPPGITTFGFWSLDKQNRRSITYSATFQIIQNAVTTLSGVLIPPTLAVTPERVAPGGTATFSGCAVPQTTVRAFVDDSETPETTLAAQNGDWSIIYSVAKLAAEQYHHVKANYISPTNIELKSGYSALTDFYVGNLTPGTKGLTADLNNDGLVNLTDFSILLFNWNTANTIADINSDGTVSLPDFSIMLFYWTG